MLEAGTRFQRIRGSDFSDEWVLVNLTQSHSWLTLISQVTLAK
jgi:hypothetical protein